MLDQKLHALGGPGACTSQPRWARARAGRSIHNDGLEPNLALKTSYVPLAYQQLHVPHGAQYPNELGLGLG